MGLFNFKKKKDVKVVFLEPSEPDDDMEHLTKKGELPYGWVYRNREFTSKIENEYSYFWKMYIDNKSPKEQCPALKSFILYLEDVEKLCKSKGECFEFWFYEILTSRDYLPRLKEELNHLIENMDSLQEEYELRLRKEEEKQQKIIEIKPDVILLLKENDGILQSDFWKLFDDELCRSAASDIVYALTKEGKIERIKSGRSYILHYKG